MEYKEDIYRFKMNKALVCFGLLMVLLAPSLSLSVAVGQASSTIRKVPTDYPTIQAGIDAAVPGDVVLVDSGTYFENVIINKTVSLVGQSKDTTIIDGNQIGKVVTVAARYINLSGFTVRRSGQQLRDSGIFLDFHSVGSKISGNIVVDNYHGIFLESSTGNVISFNNVSSNTGRGINLEFSSGNVISSNLVSQNDQDTGIELFDSTSNIIIANTMSRNWYSGIYLSESPGNTIEENTVSNNNITGVYFDASSNNTLYRNNFLSNGLNELGQLFSTDSLNAWGNGAEGNYWSDYVGLDENGDGIGDTGTIPHLGVDSKPLIDPWSHLRVFPADDSVVTVVSNSTIARFSFAQPQAEINFNATGASSAFSFCNVTIPKKLLNASHPKIWAVTIDGAYFSHAATENMTHTSIYFTFTHSTRQIKIQVVELPNLPPTADFSYSPIDPTPYDTVGFTDFSTDDGTIASWLWEFGDGNSDTVQHPQHRYAIAGVYPVTLKVTDDRGNSTSTSKAVSVRRIGTSAIVDAPSKVNRGELFRITVNLQDESQNPLQNSTIWVYILNSKWDDVGHDETNASGIASVEYTPALTSGAYLFKAVFNGTQIFAESSSIFQIEVESPDGAPPPSTSLLDEPLLRIGVICAIAGVAVALIILWRRRRIAHSLEDVKKGTS